MNPIKNTGKRLHLLPKRWMFRYALNDLKGFPIPIFRSMRLNRAILKLADALKKQKTKSRP